MTTIDLNKSFLNTSISENQINKTIKLGKYNFINCLPVNLPMEYMSEDLIQSTYGTPEVINKAMFEGKIHVGPISSYEYLKNKDKYILLKDISISSQKSVGSVMLFSNFNFNELTKKNIAVAHTSSTSVRLLELLIRMFNTHSANFTKHYYEKDIFEQLKTFDAVLYIGDPALLIAYKLKNQNMIKVYDLAQKWYEQTNLPMVFGVWVASKSWAENNPDTLKFVNDCLINSKHLGLNQLFNNVIRKANQLSNLPETVLVNYFKNQLSYDFSELQQLSLDQFNCQLQQNILL